MHTIYRDGGYAQALSLASTRCRRLCLGGPCCPGGYNDSDHTRLNAMCLVCIEQGRHAQALCIGSVAPHNQTTRAANTCCIPPVQPLQHLGIILSISSVGCILRG